MITDQKYNEKATAAFSIAKTLTRNEPTCGQKDDLYWHIEFGEWKGVFRKYLCNGTDEYALDICKYVKRKNDCIRVVISLREKYYKKGKSPSIFHGRIDRTDETAIIPDDIFDEVMRELNARNRFNAYIVGITQNIARQLASDISYA